MMKSQGIYTELKSILKSPEKQMERTETDGNGRKRTETDGNGRGGRATPPTAKKAFFAKLFFTWGITLGHSGGVQRG